MAERTVMRFLGQCGAIVSVTQNEPRWEGDESAYTAECAGCLFAVVDERRSTRVTISRARDWANQHATTCRALPQANDTEGA